MAPAPREPWRSRQTNVRIEPITTAFAISAMIPKACGSQLWVSRRCKDGDNVKAADRLHVELKFRNKSRPTLADNCETERSTNTAKAVVAYM